MNNIVNHSCAEEVLINLSLNENENNISIPINDNGKGFDIEKVYKNSDKHGFGLKGIRERVKLFNGKLEIQSSPETGTEFMVSVPIGGK
ncbi:MAG: GHKL domain-containing protein [Ignavibacteria bacterium]|nr:GHKL domain-containing protein [Ignavibacteria bacterium]